LPLDIRLDVFRRQHTNSSLLFVFLVCFSFVHDSNHIFKRPEPVSDTSETPFSLTVAATANSFTFLTSFADVAQR
jgi:hypothetical protein